MMKPMIALKTVGVLAVLTASFGLLYNGSVLLTVFTSRLYPADAPYYIPALLIMSGICISCFVILITVGIHFSRGRMEPRVVKVFTWLMRFEVVYFVVTSLLWLVPEVGYSIAAAFGMANGGLMAQGVILFPIWAPFVVKWAKRRLEPVS